MHSAYMETPGSRLKTARLRKGIVTAVEAADLLGIPRTTYQNYEDGSRGFSRQIFRLAAFYGVRANWLAHGKPPMTASELEKKLDALAPADQEKAIEYIDMLVAKAATKSAPKHR